VANGENPRARKRAAIDCFRKLGFDDDEPSKVDGEAENRKEGEERECHHQHGLTFLFR
jgi:hypothetical protein